MSTLLASMCIHNLIHVYFLKKYIPDVNHVIDWNVIQVDQEVNLPVKPDWKVKFLWNRTIGLVKVHWTYYGIEYAT
jgi:hypothetical protein